MPGCKTMISAMLTLTLAALVCTTSPPGAAATAALLRAAAAWGTRLRRVQEGRGVSESMGVGVFGSLFAGCT